MQYEPLIDLQRVHKVIMSIDTAVFPAQGDINLVEIADELTSVIELLRPILTEVTTAFNAIDQAKSIKLFVNCIDQAMDKIHVLEDCEVLTPGEAGEALSGLGNLADYADSLIDPDFLKSSLN